MVKLFFLLILIFSFSFSKIEEGEKVFQSLVVGYNHSVIKAAQKNKFEHLKEYLTKEIYYKTLVWIESYQDNNLFMDALLLNIKFKDLKIEKYTATLETDEKWKFRYINVKTKEVVKEPKGVEYKLKYYFVLLKNGKWKINHIKILDEKNYNIDEKMKNED